MDLHEVINEIDDITDPSSMEKILMYVDYIQQFDQEFIELLIDKLPYMEITWEQPWYQHSKCLTRPFLTNNNEKENLISYRSDKITEKEKQRILKNWGKFRKNLNIPDNLQCIARWKNTYKSRNPNTLEERVRHSVISYLAKGLKRNLYQVYKYVVTEYGSPVKGKYSLEEEKLMEVCFYHNARNAVPILSKVLGRESRGIYKKLKEWLNGKEDGKRMKWNLPQATKFLNHFMEHTGLPLEELKNKRFDNSIWKKLEKDMDHPYIYLQQFWYNKLHVQLFVKKKVSKNKLRKRIASKLQETSCRMWRDIRWKELSKEFPDGFTYPFLYNVWRQIFRDYKDFVKIPLNDLIEYAMNRIPLLKNRRLITLTLNNERILIPIEY